MKRLRYVGALWAIAVAAAVLGAISPAQGDITLVPSLSNANLTGTTTITGTLSVSSTVTASGQVIVSDGSAAAPSIAFSSDNDGTGTGVRRSAANTWMYVINGVDENFINANGIFPNTANANALGGNGNEWGSLTASVIQGGRVKALVDASATAFVSVSVPNSSGVGVRIAYAIVSEDATNTQIISGEAFSSCVATSGGAVTCAALSDQHVQNAVSAGTLTNTMTQATGANLVTFSANANTSLTATAHTIRYRVEILGSDGSIVVTGL